MLSKIIFYIFDVCTNLFVHKSKLARFCHKFIGRRLVPTPRNQFWGLWIHYGCVNTIPVKTLHLADILWKVLYDVRQRTTENRFLSFSPYLKKSQGIGMRASAMKPSTEFPHPSPSSSYNGRPARGRKAPVTDCRILLAARADAEYLPNVSTRYMLIEI